tara:strand:+ start:25609 stop:27300 length:1692 start_codon:yes stop_codon:yes gene_type:complete
MARHSLKGVSSLGQLLALRAEVMPDAMAYSFLSKRGTRQDTLSYAQLYRAGKICAAAMGEFAKPGETVLIAAKPGLKFIEAFFASQLAGLIAVPVNPGRLRAADCVIIWHLARDAGAKAIFCDDDAAAAIMAHDFASSDVRILTSSQVAEKDDCGSWKYSNAGSQLAYLQYTSGSMGAPKGVMVGHDNVLHNSAVISEKFGHQHDSVGVIWLPPYHDMGLVGGIIQPLYAGFPVHLMEPAEFIRRPATWLEAITKFRATTSGGPSFAYEYCLKRIPEKTRGTYDLRSWRLAFCGAEPVSAETLQRFQRGFHTAGFQPRSFYPCYGLAEATLFVTGRHIDPEAEPINFEEPISCGSCAKGTELRILELESNTEVTEGTVGEVFVSSPSVAYGYWGREKESQAVFSHRLDDDVPGIRTGDLGYVRGGELYVVGRKSSMIIIRGKNYYPEDIEAAISSKVTFFSGQLVAAVGTLGSEGEAIAILAELSAKDFAHVDRSELSKEIQALLVNRFGVRAEEIVFLRAGRLPRTDTGKVKRSALADILSEQLCALTPQAAGVLPKTEPAE